MSEEAKASESARAVPITGEHKAVPPPSGRFLAWDLPVVIGALVVLAVGWRVHASLTRPRTAVFRSNGLVMTYPADLGLRDPALVPDKPPLRVGWRKPGDLSRAIVVQIDRRVPMLGSVAAGLELERAQTYGPSYTRLETGNRSLGNRDFLRTRFRIAGADGGPSAVWGIEYAWPLDPATSSPYLYRVTVVGSEAGVAALESSSLSTLIIASSPTTEVEP